MIDFLRAEVGGHRLVKQDAFDEGKGDEAVLGKDFGVTRLNQRVDHIVSRDVRGLGIGQQAEPERVVQERVQSLMHQKEGGEANRIACLVELGKASRIEQEAAAIGRAVGSGIGCLPTEGKELAIGERPMLGDAAHRGGEGG